MKSEVDSSLYTLPLYVNSSLNWLFRIVFILGIISSSLFVYLLIYLSITTKSDITAILFILFFLLLDACFVYILFFYDISRKGYIEITDEYLKFPDMYRPRKFLWNEIHSVGIYYLNGNTILGIALKKNLIRQRSLWKRMNSALGDPYDIRLSLSMYKKINENKLLLTIENQLNKFQQ